MRTITISINFEVSTDLTEIGLGGLRQEWVQATDEQTGREYRLDSGAGLGNPLMEASVHDPTTPTRPSRHVYARATMHDFAPRLWDAMAAVLDEQPEGAPHA